MMAERMNSIQWMIRRYTSADVQLSADETKLLEQRCNELATAHQARFWIIIVLTAITSALAAFAGGRLLGPSVASLTGLDAKWCRAGTAIIFALVSICIWMAIYTLMYVRPLRRALCELGYHVCVRCGYWLRGLDESITQCPECGTGR